MGETKISVYLLDDHEVVREGLRALLEASGDITVVGESGSARDATARIPALRPQVAVLDARLPDGSGIEVCRAVRAIDPDIGALILTSYDDDEALFAAIMAGASGYVLKHEADHYLVDAVRAVAAGDSFLTNAAQRALVRTWMEDDSPGPREPLTPREQEVVKLIAEAHTNAQIAEILHLSEKTVESHRANVLRKLGMRDRVELVRYAIRRGLVEP